jgi:hypothetical protein
MNNARHLTRSSLARPARLGLPCQQFFIFAGGAFAVQLGRPRGDGELGGGHARELVGDAVRLMLEWVVDLSEDELRLYVWCTLLDAYGLQALMFSVGLLHLTLRAPATAGASALKLWLGHAHRPTGLLESVARPSP